MSFPCTYDQNLPVGTFVIPGKSTKVRFSTWGENIFKFIDTLDIPLFFPIKLMVLFQYLVIKCAAEIDGCLDKQIDR